MTHYDTLQVSRTASTEVIDAVWRTLMKAHHPDKQHGNEDYARRLNEAHEVLSDPEKRKAYDATLKPQNPQTVRMPRPAPHVDETAYPAAYPNVPRIRFDPAELYQEVVSAIDLPNAIEHALEEAGKAVLGRIIRENPIVGEILNAAQKKAREHKRK